MKAILIVDLNNDTDLSSEAYVIIDNGDFHLETEAYLKPLPKKLEFKTDRLTLESNMDEIDNYIKNLGYERVGNIHDTIGGYNACLDEILGEKKE